MSTEDINEDLKKFIAKVNSENPELSGIISTKISDIIDKLSRNVTAVSSTPIIQNLTVSLSTKTAIVNELKDLFQEILENQEALIVKITMELVEQEVKKFFLSFFNQFGTPRMATFFSGGTIETDEVEIDGTGHVVIDETTGDPVKKKETVPGFLLSGYLSSISQEDSEEE